ncbi:flagellar biosynthetic protein FliR [Abyssibius alkaniclasticus]|uniref:flagellar biosynthetic protein FliR n=1 Tax=Abyssibius alkaniclasticus TaxID=2881234 RepID=UPI0023640BEC|nr:flagellar biosynthetic protein FliR [Abyssibius alkaniclasticus]UPH72405.1 flagellar biosynthetic protein FliR [Abyssibius alkaniclasticus]|tara:strand:- start:311 stop:1093 length:783 start_codon:yes stop_codon:yes gene_type:complete
MFDAMAAIMAQVNPMIGAAVLVFMRIGAFVALLPGFGEQTIPMRLRLAAILAFTLISWPLVAPNLPTDLPPFPALAVLMLIELAIGALMGIAVRLLVMALQIAGAIAAQTTAVSQMAGVAVTPEPMPAIGNALVLAGLALALAAGLPAQAVRAIAESYAVFPAGVLPVAGDVAQWGVARVADAFALGLTLAAPFVIAAFGYNLALGFLNRAMPALMVAFVGAPAITAGALLLLMLAAPLILNVWHDRLSATLEAPWALPQ